MSPDLFRAGGASIVGPIRGGFAIGDPSVLSSLLALHRWFTVLVSCEALLLETLGKPHFRSETLALFGHDP